LRRRHFEAFRPVCPHCAAQGRPGRALLLAQVLAEADDTITAGVLHCPEPACQLEFPIIDGIPVIVADLRRLFSDRGVELLVRGDLDPVLESLAGDAIGPDSWFDALRQTLSTYGWDAFGDLDPDQPPAGRFDGPRPGAARRCLARLLALAGEPQNVVRVLDLGCAAGRTSFDLAQNHPGALVLGIDRSFGLLRLAQAAARGTVSYPRREIGLVYHRRSFPVALDGSGHVDFWACDALALPFAPGTADLVAALNILDCVPEPHRLLAGIAEAVRPGGSILLATPYDWSTRATPMESWIGGHSQRAAHGGSGEAFLHTLLQECGHPQSVAGLRILGEVADWPWQTRVHDRSTVQYRTHLLALARRENDG
jgi:SAM-dependent methyltransferase